ncbi:MAG: ubiquinone biosynthesis protein [Flavobacteriales bacterium]
MSRIRRLIKITTTIGRFRLDEFLPGEKLKWPYRILLGMFKIFPQNPNPRAVRLRLALEELGPIFIKFGQLLSTRPDLIDEDLIEELNCLQDKVKPFSNTTFKVLVETALEAKTEDLFLDFETSPLASASIAQVHCATLLNGKKVVIKAVRPGIEKTIEQDIQLLLLIARLIERFYSEGKRLKPVEVVDNYRDTIFDELDLIREAANASQLRRNFERNPELYIPEVYWEYTRKNVMVMERIYGIPVSDRNTLIKQGTDLKRLAERGVEIFFTQVFDHNFFHADMHPGNVFVSKQTPNDPSYIAVDMAIVGSLSKEDQYYLARNLLAMFRRDYRQVAELHVLSGWVPEGTSISGFETAIRSVCEPIFQKPLKEISFGEALINLFRTAQRFNMPVQPQLVLLQKTLLNIEGLGRQLYPELDLWQTAHPFLEKWLKERFHPRMLLKELKYHAPEWMEKFPELPHLIYNTLKASSHSQSPPSENTKTVRQPSRRKFIALASLTAGLTTFFLAPTAGLSISREFILLGATVIALLSLW